MHLSGSITALATPFTASGTLDLGAWSRLLARQLDAGTHAVVVAGSTGEAAALDDLEYDTLLAAAVAQVDGRIPVLAGTGLSNTAKTIAATRRAATLGADAALVVTPPYVRPTQAGLLAHYRAVADEGGLPIVLYNVPGRTGCDLLPATAGELSLHPRVLGIKEARAEAERMDALLAFRRPGFSVLSGDDPTAAALILLGAHGNISVTANVAPKLMHDMCAAALAGDLAETRRLDARLLVLNKALFVESNPIPVKWALAEMGLTSLGYRLPLTTLGEAYHDVVRSALKESGLI